MASGTTASSEFDSAHPLPQMPPEVEDPLIQLRIMSDERGLRKVIKKFHTYVFASEPGGVAYGADDNVISLEEARESLLAELATFQMMLQKSALVCQAEARQVVEYERERERIGKEHDVTRSEIAKLKIVLEEAQLLRKRKIEYDQVAEKVNLFPSRSELYASTASVQEEISAIQVEHQHKARMMQARKGALDQIVTSLEALRLMDKEPMTLVHNEVPAATLEGAGEGEEDQHQREDREDREDDRRDREREREARDREEDGEEGEEAEVAQSALNPNAKSFVPKTTFERLRDAEAGSSPGPSAVPSIVSSPTAQKPDEGEEGEEHEDIEMGEVSEMPTQTPTAVNGRTKKRQKEDKEEGEASDGSSALTELPED